MYIHRLIWEFYNGPIPSGLYLCHHCDNPPCWNPKHLFLGTQKDNIGDSSKKGRIARGEAHYLSKLSERNVLDIISDPRKINLIANEYQVNELTIEDIKEGRTWKWLTGVRTYLSRESWEKNPVKKNIKENL